MVWAWLQSNSMRGGRQGHSEEEAEREREKEARRQKDKSVPQARMRGDEPRSAVLVLAPFSAREVLLLHCIHVLS